jgi:hypothetical protein
MSSENTDPPFTPNSPLKLSNEQKETDTNTIAFLQEQFKIIQEDDLPYNNIILGVGTAFFPHSSDNQLKNLLDYTCTYQQEKKKEYYSLAILFDKYYTPELIHKNVKQANELYTGKENYSYESQNCKLSLLDLDKSNYIYFNSYTFILFVPFELVTHYSRHIDPDRYLRFHSLKSLLKIAHTCPIVPGSTYELLYSFIKSFPTIEELHIYNSAYWSTTGPYTLRNNKGNPLLDKNGSKQQKMMNYKANQLFEGMCELLFLAQRLGLPTFLLDSVFHIYSHKNQKKYGAITKIPLNSTTTLSGGTRKNKKKSKRSTSSVRR